jgi:hypothetical protein
VFFYARRPTEKLLLAPHRLLPSAISAVRRSRRRRQASSSKYCALSITTFVCNELCSLRLLHIALSCKRRHDLRLLTSMVHHLLPSRRFYLPPGFSCLHSGKALPKRFGHKSSRPRSSARTSAYGHLVTHVHPHVDTLSRGLSASRRRGQQHAVHTHNSSGEQERRRQGETESLWPL